jgi:catechol 2,3-dioxygenase-like lactoylglutathione lyase family enzyme
MPGGVLLYPDAVPFPKEAEMESTISNLVTQFEKGTLSRRELVRGLVLMAASGTAAAAATDEIDFKTADIDHVSMQVANLDRSVAFYQKMFDFKVVSEDKPLGIVRLGNNRTLVSFNRQSPTGIVDHFSIGVPRFTKEAATRYLTARGQRPDDDPYHGLHIKDPDGIHVQISELR